MKNIKSHHIIACGVFAFDIKNVLSELDFDASVQFLEGGLHDRPMELRRRLQESIDDAAAGGVCSRISLGYGICGLGAIGLESRSLTLALPRVHDCIALFLGSDRAYRQEFKKYPGTYYISAGWYEEKVQPGPGKPAWSMKELNEHCYDELRKKYGKDNALEIMNFSTSWQRNYQRAAFIDTGVSNKKKYEKIARQMADDLGWKFESIKGSDRLLRALLTADETTDEILLAPPGHITLFDAAMGKVAAQPDARARKKNTQDSIIATASAGNTGLPSLRSWNIEYGLGIDAGGTYTDAVIYNFNADAVIASNKAFTTRWDYTVGIGEALDGIDRELLARARIVSLSTTLATNAIVEGEGQKVGLLIMPGYDFLNLDGITHEPKVRLSAQMDMSGIETIGVDKAEVQAAARELVAAGVKAFAVSGFASTRNPAHEMYVKKILVSETGFPVTCGYELSGLLDYGVRAMTAVVNARIIPLIKKLLADLEIELKKRGIHAPVVVVKGDGTLLSSAVVSERPVETILSGPAASAAGARYLTGASEAIIVDIGGTTTDCATIERGAVAISEQGAVVGGFRTHVRALAMRTEGIGGDSHIMREHGRFSIGPKRIAPMALLGSLNPLTGQALDFMERRLDYYRYSTESMQVFALTGHASRSANTPQERAIEDLLSRHPQSLDQLAAGITETNWGFHLKRMVDDHRVARYGFTPTDLLHARGKFIRWDPEISKRLCGLWGLLAEMETDALIDHLLDAVVNKVSVEIIKKELEDAVNTDRMDDCEVCRLLIANILNPDPQKYSVHFSLNKPLIGIGAPAHYFLPGVGKKLGAVVIVPEHAPVANAVGAITSRVVVRKECTIVSNGEGAFSIQGLALDHGFDDLFQAQEFLKARIAAIVIAEARECGTSENAIRFDIRDSVVPTRYGTELFMGRTISAELVGYPDLVVQG